MDRWLCQTVRMAPRAFVPVFAATAVVTAGWGVAAKPSKGTQESDSSPFGFSERGSIFADPFPSPASVPAGDLLLSPRASTRAESLALYAAAALLEQQEGWAQALPSYQESLALDPANANLAARLAGELIAQEKPAEALRILKDAHAFAPDNPVPLVELASVYLGTLRRPDVALTYAEKAYRLAPESTPVLAVYLDTCATGQLGQRIEDALRRAIQSQNDDANYWLEVGSIFRNALTQRNGSSKILHARVNDLFKKALTLSPDNPAVLEAVSDHYALTQQWTLGAAFYQRSLAEYRKQNGVSSPGIYMKWARVLLQGERMEEAIQLLQQLLTEHPSFNEAREVLGELHLQQGQILPALVQFNLALNAESSTAEDFLRVAQLQLRIKRPRDAVGTTRKGRDLYPEHPQLTMVCAIALAEVKEHSEALRCFEEAEKLFTSSQKSALDSGFYLTYGAAAERAGLLVEAARLLQKSIELDPENAEALNYLGFMWVDRNQNLDEAGALIRRALDVRPNTPAYLDSLGWWHFRKGQFDDAHSHIRKALEQIPREEASEVYDHLGDILEKLSRHKEALDAWKTARELNPELQGVWDKIKKAQDNE
jgi:tetratricopeptide (TPR) repeat protein